MQRHKLTKTFVDSVPLSPDKQVFYKDQELTGFALRVTKTKSYVAEKKLPNGTTCRVTIGQHGLWTVTQAREEAKEYLMMISKGINPNAEKTNKISKAKKTLQTNKAIPPLDEAYTFYKSRKKLALNALTAYYMCIDDYEPT